jgi:hypothetical protein
VTAKPSVDVQVDDTVEVFIEPQWAPALVIRRAGPIITVVTQTGSFAMERYFNLCEPFVRLPRALPASTAREPIPVCSTATRVAESGSAPVVKQGLSSNPNAVAVTLPSSVPVKESSTPSNVTVTAASLPVAGTKSASAAVARQGPSSKPNAATDTLPSAAPLKQSSIPISVASAPSSVVVAAVSPPVAGAQSASATRPTRSSIGSSAPPPLLVHAGSPSCLCLFLPFF